MSATPWTVGRYVVETLAANGIDTVFGIPGVHNIELYRGLEFARLRHVLVRHEQNAGFAADGYARVTGAAAAAFVISGPGVTNALTAVAQAYSDSVPLLVVASALRFFTYVVPNAELWLHVVGLAGIGPTGLDQPADSPVERREDLAHQALLLRNPARADGGRAVSPRAERKRSHHEIGAGGLALTVKV